MLVIHEYRQPRVSSLRAVPEGQQLRRKRKKKKRDQQNIGNIAFGLRNGSKRVREGVERDQSDDGKWGI